MSGWALALQLLVLPAVLLSLVEAAYLPLALVAHARRPADPLRVPSNPFVSVVVPAFDEGRVLRRCVDSILADRYLNKEVVLVDDGSRDDTWEVMKSYRGRPGVVVAHQTNAGKAAALNHGISLSRGSVLMFVDADGVFSGWTVRGMLRGFDDPRVGAVCGNDAPVNLDRFQPRLLTLLTHVTAMVRRALAQVNCLTIVSGNCGAVRREVLDEVGGFTEGLLGEDLELTWRVRRAGYRVSFQPEAIVYAEVPAGVGPLWRQRVRWARGYLQTLWMHRDLVGSVRHGVVGPYLAINALTMVVAPVLQLVALGIILGLAVDDSQTLYGTPASTLAWALLLFPVLSVVVSAALNGSWRDLRFFYVLLVMPVYSTVMNAVMVTAIVQQLRRRPSRWNKLERTGVSSRHGIPDGAPV